MLILFDHGTPAPLRSFLKRHTVKKTKDLGWDTLSNGELLRAAEEAAFEIFLTTVINRISRSVSLRFWSWAIRDGLLCNGTLIESWRL